MTVVLPLVMLMQIGTDLHVYPQAQLPAITPRRPAASAKPTAPPDRLSECLAHGDDDLDAGLTAARAWLAEAKTAEERVAPNQCLGLLLTDDGAYGEAEAAFAAAIEAINPPSAPGAVPLMALAGNAALADGAAARALGWYDRALAIKDFDNPGARGAIEAVRARALVALDRAAEAQAALAEARRLAPGDAEVFLLSATLARRGQDLKAAQGFIETAALLDPVDPRIGLEAGVIAVLGGHDDAARKSWQSVIAAAPDSAPARSARAYLAQLADAGPAKPAPARAAEGR